MKKPLSINLSIENHNHLKEKGEEVGSASFWLDRHLTSIFDNTNNPSSVQQLKQSKLLPKKPKNHFVNDEFEMVWNIYEKKGNKKTSQAKFNKLSSNQKQLMANHLQAYVNSTPDKEFRKNLETYINQECWNDEIEVKNGRIEQRQAETTSDRYAQQSRELEARERQNQTIRHQQDPSHLFIDG